MNRPQALIVDDEADIRDLAELTLGRMDIQARSAANLAEARRLLEREAFGLCLTDMRLPDGDGLDLVRHITSNYPHMPVAMITAYGSIDTAIQALKAGAFDFVTKPVDLSVLRQLVEHALRLSESPADRRSRDILLGESSPMRAIRSTVVKVARSQAPVYICGESGTGKELIARLIHDKGPRRGEPFVPVNCGAIPAELMESEFFGHRKGSFTGASSDREGLFQAAHGGTLFLDEVADLPPHMQVKLLRAIQEKAVRPVGSSSEVPVDVRILSASHRDLDALVAAGEFRQDLFYRIHVIQVRAPSLREHPEDIPLLVDHMLRAITGETDHGFTLSDDALRTLQCYRFPGNVRELENVLERVVALSDGSTVTATDLNLPEDGMMASPAVPLTPEPGDGFELESYLEDIERGLISRALEKSGNNKTAAAQLLGISFRALRYRLKKLDME
ncbi:Transcriptional regulatory protein GlrR [wastewater metagenome]|uniref:Transcriptional regulatory protein GlrR n=3 Tax=root TaxID=1 RepID=A0A5B8RCV1_9ZZZZ|nr:transcriptional regulatory protein GlrR [uncultured organism]